MKPLSRTAIYERTDPGSRWLAIYHNRAIVSRRSRTRTETDVSHLARVARYPREDAEAASADDAGSIHVFNHNHPFPPPVGPPRDSPSPVELAAPFANGIAPRSRHEAIRIGRRLNLSLLLGYSSNGSWRPSLAEKPSVAPRGFHPRARASPSATGATSTSTSSSWWPATSVRRVADAQEGPPRTSELGQRGHSLGVVREHCRFSRSPRRGARGTVLPLPPCPFPFKPPSSPSPSLRSAHHGRRR